MRILGFAAERRAEKYLKKHGMTLVERNFAAKCGEIDLIMQDHQTIVFVEVRMRRNNDFGDALSSVDPIKQQKLHRTADVFLQKRQLMGYVDVRFDIIAIDGRQLRWIKNALD